jgi:hypothetical protein
VHHQATVQHRLARELKDTAKRQALQKASRNAQKQRGRKPKVSVGDL